ncbi:MAG: hypothetical protein O2856_10890, partial [Planctomycetota bacterium]|nr:hypothetical protein [Planctomycetota bacterium]
EIIGYRAMEHQFTPDSQFELQAPTAIFWHPGIKAALTGDTILVMPGGCEIVTRSSMWPQLRVQVKGHDVSCCGLLLIKGEKPPAVSNGEALAKISSHLTALQLPDDDADDARMDSIWELDMTSHQSVFDESESEYSEESVLD